MAKKECATRDDLRAATANLATRDDFRAAFANLVTRDDLHALANEMRHGFAEVAKGMSELSLQMATEFAEIRREMSAR